MLIARVVGSAVATVKDEKLGGVKLLVVREADVTGKPTGKPMVAVDTVDAGIGDLVLTASGSSARQTHITQNRPVDTVIMAILDSLEVEGEITYRKS
ncbi:MAG: ethanolamine utilization protein EutN [Caldilineae bacterium]|nr:MAG: ethanolamine utilization protein EutN [Caldilineae bacterium]